MKVDQFPRLPAVSDPRFVVELVELLRRHAVVINDGQIRSGPSTERPAGADLRPGRLYVDETINQAIRWNGAAWVALDGSAL